MVLRDMEQCVYESSHLFKSCVILSHACIFWGLFLHNLRNGIKDHAYYSGWLGEFDDQMPTEQLAHAWYVEPIHGLCCDVNNGSHLPTCGAAREAKPSWNAKVPSSFL